MLQIDQQAALQRAKALHLHSDLDAAFLAAAEQPSPGKVLTLYDAVKLIDNDQVLEYSAFLYESRTRVNLENNCPGSPPSAESLREWLMSEESACLARLIAAVAAELDTCSQ